jgi:hypothetical protein
LSYCDSAAWFEDTTTVLKCYTSNGNHNPLERISDSYILNEQVEDIVDREGSLEHNFVVWIRTNPKKHTYETHKTEMARLKEEVVEHNKRTRSIFQDLTFGQRNLIPMWEAALACVAAADAASAGLEAARFTIQMTWWAFQFASLTSVDHDWPCGSKWEGSPLEGDYWASMEISQDMTSSEKLDLFDVDVQWNLAWNYERLLDESFDPVEQELARWNRDFHGWDSGFEIDVDYPQQYQEQIEELSWKPNGNPDFWKTHANFRAAAAEMAADRALHTAVKLTLMYADSVEKRVARRAVECKETGELPPCINTPTKARTWASKIMKTNCYTKSGTDRSPPNLGLLVGRDGMPVFQSLIPNQGRSLRSLKYPADFILLFRWMHGKGHC